LAKLLSNVLIKKKIAECFCKTNNLFRALYRCFQRNYFLLINSHIIKIISNLGDVGVTWVM